MTLADLATVETLILKRFKSEIETPNSLSGFVDYPNAVFQKPATSSATWCRVRIQTTGGAERNLFAGKVDRARGNLVVQCFTPSGAGHASANDFAWSVVRAFSAQEADGIRYLAAAPTQVGQSEGSYQINVVVPWVADETS